MITPPVALALLVGSSVVHIVADVLLLRGARENAWRTGFGALIKTPRPSLLAGALLGLFTVPVWLLPAVYLINIDGAFGLWAFFSFVGYVAVLLLFHVSYAFVGIGLQVDRNLSGPYRSLLSIIGLWSMVLSAVFTVAIVLAGVGGHLDLAWYHYLSLPSITIVLFQYLLGRLLRSVPYYLATSGTLAMLTFFVGFIDMVGRNTQLLGN